LIKPFDDGRVRLLYQPFNTGTYNVVASALGATGDVIAMLSDEDDLCMPGTQAVLEMFTEDPLLDVVVASSTFGPAETPIEFPNQLLNLDARSLCFALEFSGIGGVFLRAASLRDGTKSLDLDAAGAYRAWNYYPVAFLISRTFRNRMRTTSIQTSSQTRIGASTLDWNPDSPRGPAEKRAPHFHATSIIDRARTKFETLASLNVLPLSGRLYASSRILLLMSKQLASSRDHSLIDLLQQHYSEGVLEEFRKQLPGTSLASLGQIIWANFSVAPLAVAFVVRVGAPKRDQAAERPMHTAGSEQ
jgi:hypothetical protein